MVAHFLIKSMKFFHVKQWHIWRYTIAMKPNIEEQMFKYFHRIRYKNKFEYWEESTPSNIKMYEDDRDSRKVIKHTLVIRTVMLCVWPQRVDVERSKWRSFNSCAVKPASYPVEFPFVLLSTKLSYHYKADLRKRLWNSLRLSFLFRVPLSSVKTDVRIVLGEK